MTLNARDRRQNIQLLKQEHYDLVIMGGGITGAGIALDAASRGMKVALLEREDFASGASGRSTKMIHGGLRYLKKFQIKNVMQTGKERATLYENGPHVIRREKMLIPFYRGGSFGRLTTSIGLKVYDYLAGVQKDERRQIYRREEVLKKIPQLKAEGLRGAAEYVEYRTDDARLTLEIIKRAVEMGAHCFNYLEAQSFNYDPNGYVEAVVVKDRMTQNTYLVEGDIVLNATGAWAYDFSPEAIVDGMEVRYIKGAHLVFDQKDFPLEDALFFDTEDNKQMVCAIPRGDKTYVGVSSSLYEGKRETPAVSTTDQARLLTLINQFLPALNLTTESIESSWAGVTSIVIDKHNTGKKGQKSLLKITGDGLVTVTTGKLTGYRELAESVVDEIVAKLGSEKGKTFGACQTMTLPISGGDVGGSEGFAQFIEKAVEAGIAANLTEEEARQLALIYGSNIDLLFNIAKTASPEEMQGLPLPLYLQLRYALESESLLRPSDFFIRRTGMLYFDIAQMMQYQVEVVRFMARYFSWSIEQIKHYNSELEMALYQATHPVEDDRIVKLTQKEQSLAAAPVIEEMSDQKKGEDEAKSL